jgi:hypothetical protein
VQLTYGSTIAADQTVDCGAGQVLFGSPAPGAASIVATMRDSRGAQVAQSDINITVAAGGPPVSLDFAPGFLGTLHLYWTVNDLPPVCPNDANLRFTVYNDRRRYDLPPYPCEAGQATVVVAEGGYAIVATLTAPGAPDLVIYDDCSGDCPVTIVPGGTDRDAFDFIGTHELIVPFTINEVPAPDGCTTSNGDPSVYQVRLSSGSTSTTVNCNDVNQVRLSKLLAGSWTIELDGLDTGGAVVARTIPDPIAIAADQPQVTSASDLWTRPPFFGLAWQSHDTLAWDAQNNEGVYFEWWTNWQAGATEAPAPTLAGTAPTALLVADPGSLAHVRIRRAQGQILEASQQVPARPP